MNWKYMVKKQEGERTITISIPAEEYKYIKYFCWMCGMQMQTIFRHSARMVAEQGRELFVKNHEEKKVDFTVNEEVTKIMKEN